MGDDDCHFFTETSSSMLVIQCKTAEAAVQHTAETVVLKQWLKIIKDHLSVDCLLPFTYPIGCPTPPTKNVIPWRKSTPESNHTVHQCLNWVCTEQLRGRSILNNKCVCGLFSGIWVYCWQDSESWKTHQGIPLWHRGMECTHSRCAGTV